jgi:hypothetical protein
MGGRNVVSNLPFLLKHSLTKESIEDMSQHVALASIEKEYAAKARE